MNWTRTTDDGSKLKLWKRFRPGKSKPNDRPEKPLESFSPNANTSSLSTSHRVIAAVKFLTGLGSTGYSRGDSPVPPSGLGLRVIHDPELPCLDIIFVHGLGGHSQKTWSNNYDPALFWPELWLPLEPGVGRARISTFGYNSNWRDTGKNDTSISDFAKELLYEMRFGKYDSGAEFRMGKQPIIFVGHSMGGLVVKKAYLLGLLDENYKYIINSVSAIIFLSTPHLGSNLAKTLNRVLSASFQSRKNFISDLKKSSRAIEDLNEQFRHLAPRLSICSFYETLETSIGSRKVMVLDKGTAVLGYTEEISKTLWADHHDVCKYRNSADPNYKSVKNVITSLVGRFGSRTCHGEEISDTKSTVDMQELFRNCPSSEDDFNTLRQTWKPETCGWFLQEPDVVSWLEPSPESRVLWYCAPPGNGKSVLAAFIISHLRALGLPCPFFLFRYSDHNKRTVAGAFRSLAFQLTENLPQFRSLLVASPPDNLGHESEDPYLIWRNMFEKTLFQTDATDPVYLAVDALDECDSSKVFLHRLRGIPRAKIPIRFLVLSRNTDAISAGFDRLSRDVTVARIEKTGKLHNQLDIARFVQFETQHMRGSYEFQQQLTQTILRRSEGNFLWTRLVLEELMTCHTEKGIHEVLDEIPGDMNELYQRMELILISSTRKSNIPLIRALLEWIICAEGSLSLKELASALQPEFSTFLDLKRTVKDTCGQFIQVSDDGQVRILHHTVREYLTTSPDNQLYINSCQTHERLFMRTVIALEEPGLRWTLAESQHSLQATQPFLFYAAINWPSHLSHSHSSSSESLNVITRFLRSPAILAWIHALALLRRLEVLVKASKILASFARTTRKNDTSIDPIPHRLQDLELLDDWAVDLVKIIGKFGRNIVSRPAVIYDVVPALCPTQTVLHRQCYDQGSTNIKILGSEDSTWNDNLARLAVSANSQVWEVSCAGKYLAALTSTSTIHIWDSTNFAEIATISHGEPVTAMTLNSSGGKLATYGLGNTKIWSIPSGKLLSTTPNPPYTKAVAMAFTQNDSELLAGGDDNTLRYLLCDSCEGWQNLNPTLLKDTAQLEGSIINSPVCFAFNGDKTQVGVSYRGAPLSVWRLDDGRCINLCRRAKNSRSDARRVPSNWFAVDRLTWNPVTNHVLGIYRDGCIFKWHPLTDENIEAQAGAGEIAASPNGKLFVTSGGDGSVRVWNFALFSVIYQLSSGDLVMGLAFGPDSRRFYDARGGCINAWESDSVTRFCGIRDLEPETDTTSNDRSSTLGSKFFQEVVPRFESVAALAPAPKGEAYCVGYEDGNVLLFRRGQNSGMELARFYNFLCVTHVRWSPDGRCVAIADLAAEIQIKTVRQDGHGEMGVSSLVTPNIDLDDTNIQEMLLNADGELLLITTKKKAFVCALGEVDSTLVAFADLERIHDLKWLCHPTLTDVLLAFGPQDVQAYRWQTLEKLCAASYHALQQRPALGSRMNNGELKEVDPSETASLSLSDDNNVDITLSKAIFTQDSKHILLYVETYAITHGARHAAKTQVMIFPLGAFQPSTHGDDDNQCPPLSSPLCYFQVPAHTSTEIKIPLAILPGLRLIFLDQDLWLCSYHLGSSDMDACHRFYFVPRDWMGSKSLELCSLMEDGTLLWPKNDRVVLIESSLDEIRLSSLY